MMPLYIFLSVFLLLIPPGADENAFTILGDVEGMEDTIIELIGMNQSGGEALAKTSLESGTFVIKGTVEHPVYAALKFVNQNKYIYLWLEPSEIRVSANAAAIAENPRELPATITGSREQSLMQEFLDFNKGNYREVSELVDKKKQTDDPDEQDRLEEEITEARSIARERNSAYILDFARRHNDRVVAAYAMRTQINDVYNDVMELDEVLNGFSRQVKGTHYFKEIREGLDLLMNIQPGSDAPLFTLNSWKGEKVSLSDFRGKVVLLDFWASWCAPCIASIPSMKQLYDKYHSKGFEIVGISTDSDEAAWLRSIEQHEIPWVNVIDERPDGILKSIVSTNYSVAFLPTLIIIDKEGKIVAKNVTKEDIEQILNDLL
jgi:peroxiredoxin